MARATLLVEAEKRGEERAVRRNIREALTVRFGSAIPGEVVALVEGQADLPILTRWFHLALTVPTLADFQSAIASP